MCYCGNNTKFISFSKGYLEYCSIKCASNSKKTREKYKNTCIGRYGEDNVLEVVKIKKQKVFIDNYGVKTYLQTVESKSKLIEKYGVDNPFKSVEIQKNIKESKLEK